MSGAAANPWVAMDVTTDPIVRSRALRRVHERELAGDPTGSRDVRDLVRNSWRRSLAAGVAPDQGGAPVRLTSSELEQARKDSPLAPNLDIPTAFSISWTSNSLFSARSE